VAAVVAGAGVRVVSGGGVGVLVVSVCANERAAASTIVAVSGNIFIAVPPREIVSYAAPRGNDKLLRPVRLLAGAHNPVCPRT